MLWFTCWNCITLVWEANVLMPLTSDHNHGFKPWYPSKVFSFQRTPLIWRFQWSVYYISLGFLFPITSGSHDIKLKSTINTNSLPTQLHKIHHFRNYWIMGNFLLLYTKFQMMLHHWLITHSLFTALVKFDIYVFILENRNSMMQ